jgi:hypothetical protein
MTEATAAPSGPHTPEPAATAPGPEGADWAGAATEPMSAAEPPAQRPARQPYLHDHVSCVRAPVVWISPRHGDLDGGVDGLYVADRRVLASLHWSLAGEAPIPIAGTVVAGTRAHFVSVARALGDPYPDPTVVCERDRSAETDRGVEVIRLHNRSRRAVLAPVEVYAGTDLAAMGDVKAGRSGRLLPVVPLPDGLSWAADDGARAVLTADPPPQVDAPAGRLSWLVEVPAGGYWEATLTARVRRPLRRRLPAPLIPRPRTGEHDDGGDHGAFRPTAALGAAPWRDQELVVRADDRRVEQLVRHSVADLDALRLCDPAYPEDSYFAAGSPWFLTLFGRDSLWSALLALPLGVEVLAGTLRVLARRQGVAVDQDREEAPGKILHEVRAPDAAVWLPSVYYGTVDATPLFVLALAEAWRWGLAESRVARLMPAMTRALGWLREHGDPDGDGLVEYRPSGRGLVNQGWKDSADGVQWANGDIAETPLALSEVQAYAYRAAMDGAELLDAFGLDGAGQWRDWAAALAERFRSTYWLSDADGAYPAIAVDGRKRPVDGPASNMAHLLGTGLLDPAEEALVARRLGSSQLLSEYGLRTLATTAAGFNPLAYHAGSIWPHDTMIAALGLARGGHHEPAARLVTGVLAAAPWFGYRLPELFGAHPATPLPYPPSCRPQAWAAAAGVALVRVLLGVEPDLPNGRLTLRPMAPSPVGAFDVTGLRVGGGSLAVRVAADGTVAVRDAPAGVEVVVLR